MTEVPLKTESLRHHWEFYSVPPPFLAWSSNGQRLLSLEQSAPQGAASIVRVSLQTGAKRILTSPPKEINGDGRLGVSPDGKTLAFTRTLGLFEKGIYAVSLSDAPPIAAPRRLTFDNKEIKRACLDPRWA